MYIILLIALFVFFVAYIIKNKIHIKFKTFLHKGFKKTDNKFRTRGFYGKTGDGQDI